MTGSALMDFLIAVICLCAIVGLIFYAVNYIAADETFRKIARLAVGVVALVAFLVAVKGVLFGGGGALAITPVNMIEFAIGLIVIMVVVFIIYYAIDFFKTPFSVPAKYVVGAIALIALLIIAEKALFGGGLGMGNVFQPQRHGAIEAPHHLSRIAGWPPAPPAAPASICVGCE
jgi:hypothetical protein